MTLRQRTPMKRAAPMKRTAFKSKPPKAANDNAPKLARSTIKSKGRPAPSAAEKRHMGRVAELSCVVCRNLGLGRSPAELHHPRTGVGAGQKSSNFDVIPLCPSHHRLGGHGVAYHAGPEVFEMRYGTELALLAQTLRELGLPAREAA